MSKAPLSLSVRASEIPAGGRRFHIEANESERRGLADELGIPEVSQLAADLDVRPLAGGAFSVRGALSASVVQTDIVTLEPVRQAVDEAIDVTLVAAEDAAAEPGETELPDLYRGGRIELGALTREHFALGLDPYPRAPGVEFLDHVEDDSAAEASPFAALARLRKGEE